MTREEAAHKLGDLALRLTDDLYDSYVEPLAMALKALQEPERKKGKWINPSQNPEFANKDFFNDCSLCGFTTMDETNFCPNCGALMDGRQEGELK